MPAFARADRSYVRQLRRVVGQGSRTSGEKPTESGSRREDFSSSNWCSAHAPPPKSFSKKSRSHDCVSELRFRKVRSIPRSVGVYSCFILAFLEQQLGNFSRSSLGRRLKRRFQPSLPYRRTALDPVGA